MKRVVMTGATGFIGSWLVERLLDRGVSVTALILDGEERLSPEVLNAIKIVHYNPENIHDVQDIFDGNYDTFYNIGWAGVSPEQKGDILLQLNNVNIALKALQFAAKIKCARFIGAGTVGEYAFCNGLISSNMPPSPGDVYGAAKVAAHYLTQKSADEIGIEQNWAIIPSTFEERRVDNNIITYTICSLLQQKKPTFTKLDQMWDFLYVADVVEALCLIGEHGIPGKCYGIGSGIYKPLKLYIEQIRDIIDPSLPLGIGQRRDEKKSSGSCVDISELKADTGFAPKVSFEEGIMRTIKYFKRM